MAECADPLLDDLERGVAALFAFFGEEGSRLLVPCEPTGNDVACYEFPLAPDHLDVGRILRISFPKSFPTSGLTLAIKPSPWLMWPHVLKNSVCLYGAGDEPAYGSPEIVVNNELNRFKALLQLVLPRDVERKRTEEFEREITSYWNQQLVSTTQQLILLGLPEKAAPLFVLSDQRWRPGHQDEHIWLATEAKKISDHCARLSGRDEVVKAPAKAAFFVPLQSFPGVELPTTENFFSWVMPHLSEEDANALKEWQSSSTDYHVRWLLLGIPNTSPPLIYAFVLRSTAMKDHGHTNYGRRAERRFPHKNKAGSPAVLQGAGLHLISALTVHSRDTDTNHAYLSDKHVVMVGAGTLGGTVAALLSRAGVTKFTLVDPDKLSDANIGRHILGADDLGRSKVYAVKERIQRDLPFAEITPVHRYLHIALEEKPDLLDQADLVIVTTANWWSEDYLWSEKSGGRPWALIQAWSEPHAIVGHALVAGARGDADARDLFDPNGRFSHRYTEWPHNGVIPLPGCGASFIPGGPIAITRIAAMVADVAIATLSQDMPEPEWYTSISDPSKINQARGTYLGPQVPEGAESIILRRPWPQKKPSVQDDRWYEVDMALAVHRGIHSCPH